MKAQANEHDTDNILMIQSLPLFKKQNYGRASPPAIQAEVLERRGCSGLVFLWL